MKCQICGVIVWSGKSRLSKKRRLHFDHVFPYSRGGKTTVDNLRVTCQGCNLRRGNRVDADWMGLSDTPKPFTI